MAEGKQFSIGVVEFEHNWFPFNTPISDSDDGDDSEEDEDEEMGGVSDTKRGLNGNDNLEDGEIPTYSGKGRGKWSCI